MLGRLSIEAAVSRATADDLGAIAAAAARFDRPNDFKDVDQVVAGVVDFQRAVSAASHNPILLSLETFLLALVTEVQQKSLSSRGVRFWRVRTVEFQPHRVAILDGLRSGEPAKARAAIDGYFDAQRARFEQDDTLRGLNLASPKLVTIVAEMVRQSKD